MRSPGLIPIVFVLSVLSCRKGPELVAPDSPLASELKLLERQVSSLQAAIVDAKKGELFPIGDIAVGVSQETVQRTLLQALPIEQPVAKDFRARIDRAEVTFLSMQGSVKLEGRIWALADPGTFADLTLMGGIDAVEVESGTGILTAAIVLDGWDVKRASAIGAESDWIKQAVLMLGDDALTALRALVPPIRIPVGIENGVDLPGIFGPPVTIPAGHMPFDAQVSRVLPLSGRLWAMVHVTTTGWQKATPTPTPTSTPTPTPKAVKP